MKKFLYAISGLFGILGLVAIWSLIEPYILDTEEEAAEIPNLPPAWEGKRVAQLSDFQLGLKLANTNTVERSVNTIIEERPAVALISGDFIYHSLKNSGNQVGHAIELVRPLPEAGIPTYAVLGNHDYSMSGEKSEPRRKLAAQLEKGLEEVGIVVLKNEAVELPLPENKSPSEPLYLVGVGAHQPNNDQPQVALKQLPDNSPRIAMMHNPKTFEAFPPQTAPMAIAGHTHGGQIRIPFTPQWSWLTATKKLEHVSGWSEGKQGSGNRLHVNRGIGMSIIPVRFNCPPELTMFTLRAQ